MTAQDRSQRTVRVQFGIILDGAQRAGQPREEALAELLAKARTAQQ